jgi:DNA-directed RNA polymerase subunit RPC12/RpoP
LLRRRLGKLLRCSPSPFSICFPYPRRGIELFASWYNRKMSNDAGQDKSSEEFQKFTNAVKTIVNVPKEAVIKKDEAMDKKLSKLGDVYTCSACGHKVLVIRKKEHKHP